MIITLKDGIKREYPDGTTVIDIAYDLSAGIARLACAGSVNGEVVDLRTHITEDSNVYIMGANEKGGLDAYRHTTSHIFAQAVKRLYPDAKLAIGPSIDDGFYYDIEFADSFTEADFEKVEAEMKKIIKEGIELERFELPRQEAIKLMEEKNEPYKVELIKDLPEDAVISFYSQGEFTDLCAGPHLMNTKGIKAFKLLKLAGAYWRGDSKNKMLTRIYGTSFSSKDELEEYLKLMEEAKERDHRKIGKDLDLFMSDDLIGKGLPMFLPKGYTIWQELENYIKNKERRLGYEHVMTPCVGTVDLYKTSGHWDHYKENMFPAMEVEDETFVLRPMNCPHHMRIYANSQHSYRDLPVRLAEVAHDFRFEASGALKGIERARHFCQNDSHIFVTPEQIKDEFKNVMDLIFDTYKDFGITDYRCVLSLRDPDDKLKPAGERKYHEDDEMWDNAERALRETLDEIGIEYTEEIGEAAFYGPKLDVNVKPAIGNEYTLSTCQLDFCLPAKFELTYVDADGEKKTPVVLHRAILGSLDRFMAYILEETKGKLPTWLAPIQVKVLPISDKFLGYAEKVNERLLDEGIRSELDSRSEKIGYKIREARLEKVPYILVLGGKEEEAGNVSVRSRFLGDEGAKELDGFIAGLKEEIKNKVIREEMQEESQ